MFCAEAEKSQDVLCCKFLKLDTKTGKAYSHGEEVVLTKLEYKILSSMMNNQESYLQETKF